LGRYNLKKEKRLDMWRYVLGYIVFIFIAASISEAMKSPDADQRRAEIFYNTNKQFASESTCDALQETRSPELCASMAKEKFEELQSDSRKYYE
jgi:hypothetical protein